MDVTIIKVYFKFRWIQHNEIKIQVHVIENTLTFSFENQSSSNFKIQLEKISSTYHESIKHLKDR